jgi:hypothetical protein
MVRTVAGLVDRQRAAHQRFRFAEPVGVLQQCGEVVEADRDARMVRAVAGSVDRQRAAH